MFFKKIEGLLFRIDCHLNGASKDQSALFQFRIIVVFVFQIILVSRCPEQNLTVIHCIYNKCYKFGYCRHQHIVFNRVKSASIVLNIPI